MDVRYIKPVSSGGFSEKVAEGTPGAVSREWAIPARGGEEPKSGTTHEILYKTLSGRITGASINDGQYGTDVIVNLNTDNGPVVLTMKLDSPFAQDFLKKALNIDEDKDVLLNAWAIEDEKGKTRRGLAIKQGDDKIPSAFESMVDGKREYHMGFPQPPVGTKTSDMWKHYFMGTRIWLRSYVEENKVLERFSSSSSSDVAPTDIDDGPINLDGLGY